MQKLSRLVLLVVASVTFLVGILGAIVFYPNDLIQPGQARGGEGDLKWQTSLATASDLARQEHKYVLADIYTSWCGWCKRLDKDVFSKPKVVKYLQDNFICVKVDAEEPREGVKVARAYKVNGFPCGLVFSPEGKLIGRIGGYEPADGYIQTLKQITGSASAGGQESASNGAGGVGGAGGDGGSGAGDAGNGGANGGGQQ